MLPELVGIEACKGNVAITDARKVGANAALAIDRSRAVNRDQRKHPMKVEVEREIPETPASDAAKRRGTWCAKEQWPADGAECSVRANRKETPSKVCRRD
jgi:hypothetical protein